MRYAKTLCLVALSALAAMAVVASGASANAQVCTKDNIHASPTQCPNVAAHGNQVLDNTPIHGILPKETKAVLTVTNSTGGTVRIVECEESTASGTITKGATGTGNITALTFGKCTSAGCTNVSAKTPAAGKSGTWASTVTTEIANQVNTNGVLHTEKASGTFTATCLFITATCEYEAATATTSITGGQPAILHAESVPLSKIAGAESICGTKADWKATYEITTPSSLYIV